MNNLSNIILVTKTAEVAFPGLEGFSVKVAAVSRETSKKLRESSETTVLNAKLKIPMKEVNEELFIKNFAETAIKGWKGLKYKYLDQLMLVDLSSVEDLEAEVDFSIENAVQLIKNSQIFDSWLNEAVFNLDTFRNK